ncbi:urease accessory protein UreJ [Pusillimonas sp. TS35]|nr:urease accessory protein UreJ [Pusillimonas sp. TS35]
MKNASVLNILLRALAGSVLLALSGAALAHPGHAGHETNMLAEGLIHPLTGADHLLAMVAVGLWSALAHGAARQALYAPFVFLALLLAGALLGIAGVTLPAVEPMIMASLLVLGLMVAVRLRVPAWISMGIISFFALFHGLAHGAELPAGGAAVAYITGFMLSTLALHVAGLFAGFRLKHHSHWLSRALGGGIAVYGASLLATL